MPALRLMRPKHWTKNLLVLAPLVFSPWSRYGGLWPRALLAVFYFTVASAAVYILNDIWDRSADSLHPVKRHLRPLAAGTVNLRGAQALFGVCCAILLTNLLYAREFAAPVWAYLTLNVAYDFKLKQLPVVDLFSGAFGLVLRPLAGAQAIGAPLSFWMFISTLSLALFIKALERRQDMEALDTAAPPASVIYTARLLDGYAAVAAAGALCFYSLWVFMVRPALAYSIVAVLFSVFRYWYVSETNPKLATAADALFGDLPLALGVAGWCGMCLAAVWTAQA
jgi:4-hydroxybenzoate polyprenyltransferase